MKRKRRIKKWIKIGEREKEIIELIGVGTLVIASLALPNLPIALRTISKIRGNKGLQKFLENLKKKNVIYLGEEKIRLTKKGKKLLKNIQMSKIEIKESKDWDGTWWLVSYDIPKDFNKSRDNFRFYLKRLNFSQIQASLWVFPYKCKEEIAIIANDLSIDPFVIVMATDSLPNQKEMEEYYNL